MKLRILLSAVLVMALSAFGQAGLGGGAGIGGGSGLAGTGVVAPTYLINQNFEGAGYDNGEVWTDSGAGVNPDYTTTPLTGSQSCNMVSTTVQKTIISPTFADTADLWVYWQLQFNTAMGPGNSELMAVRTSVPADVLSVTIRPGNVVRLTCGSVNSGETVGTLTTGTKYHFWLHYVKGTGANAVASIGWSTDGTKPVSGNNFVSMSNGDATGNAAMVRFSADSISSSGWDQIVDRILVDDATIGDNP